MKTIIALVVTALVAYLSVDGDAATIYPWSQQGHDGTHAGATGGTSPTTNAPLWTSNSRAELGEVHAVDHGLVFSQTDSGIVALDQTAGAVVRLFTVANPRNAAVSNGRLVVGDSGGSVYAFDIATGTLLWKKATAPTNNITVDGTRVFTNTGISDGHLRALDAATGDLIWSVGGISGSSSSPAAANGAVFQNSSGDGALLAVDAGTGSLRWRRIVGSGAARAVADASRLFFGTAAGHLLAVDQVTGDTIWDAYLGGEIYAGGTSSGLAFAVSFSGRVYALRADTGALAWGFDTGSGFQSSGVSSAGGRVFFSGANGITYALDEPTGNLLWTRDGTYVPVVADGIVFAHTASKEVVAIGSPIQPVSEPGVGMVPGLVIIVVLVALTGTPKTRALHRRARAVEPTWPDAPHRSEPRHGGAYAPARHVP